jgi:hypothetical protein
MFFIYGPQAPTAFANGPTMAQYQSDWIVDFLVRARKGGFECIEAKQETEDEWVKKVHHAWNITLFPKATGWYTGANVSEPMVGMLYGSITAPAPCVFVICATC